MERAAGIYLQPISGEWNVGRIEMVETRSQYRRRGIAAAVVAQAALGLRTMSGDTVTYLYTDRRRQ